MRAMLVAAAVLLSGCPTPYQRMGFRGGVAESPLGGGRWMIRVEVNSYTSRSTAVEYTYRRAAELCPHGFDPIDADRSSRNFYATFDGGRTVQNMPKSSASLVVQCREPVSVARAEQSRESRAELLTLPPEHQPKWKPGERPATTMDFPWWCAENSIIGSRCYRTKTGCVDNTTAMAKEGLVYGECYGVPVAACYRVRSRIRTGVLETCTVHPSHCREARDHVRINRSEDYEILSECEATK